MGTRLVVPSLDLDHTHTHTHTHTHDVTISYTLAYIQYMCTGDTFTQVL